MKAKIRLNGYWKTIIIDSITYNILKEEGVPIKKEE